MLLDDDEDDEDEGVDGELLDDEEEDDGMDGIELWEDCWLADSQPARIRPIVLITNRYLAVDFFML